MTDEEKTDQQRIAELEAENRRFKDAFKPKLTSFMRINFHTPKGKFRIFGRDGVHYECPVDDETERLRKAIDRIYERLERV